MASTTLHANHPAFTPRTVQSVAQQRLPCLVILVLSVLSSLIATQSADARTDRLSAFLQTLTPQERGAFEAYKTAQTFHNAAVDAYWGKVSKTRTIRRKRLRKRLTVTERNYVTRFPPKYTGPRLDPKLWRRWVAFRDRGNAPRRKSRSTLPDLADYLAASRKYFGFAPERIPEREFKRRYAKEALKLGLTKQQVIRVYALETAGLGTADMVAGIHPIRKTGRPISSAMGYAQLLAANTLSVLHKHGDTFIDRLEKMRRSANNASRVATLDDKISKLKSMYAYVRTIPYKWSRMRRISRTDRGRGVHAINIDGDIGPWVQVTKLRDTKRYADRAGRQDLTPEQLELMHLAGPATGLEMMSPLAQNMPTSNFFARRGYERNTIVRGKTAAQLLTALGRVMDINQRHSGAREFAQVFDDLLNAEKDTDTQTPPASHSKIRRLDFNAMFAPAR